MIDDRIAERRASVRDDRRRGRLRRTRWSVLLVLVVVGLVVLERSALVGLEEVEVTGVERLTADEVRAAADLELGTSTLRLRLGEASDRVAALPLVLVATARRVDPLTVLIEVEERQPVLVAIGEERAVYLDREGIVIDQLAAGEVPLSPLPVITLPTAPPAPGIAAEDDPTLDNAVRAWRGLSGSLRADVVTYRAAGPDELTLVLSDGIEVRFGRAERMDEKVRALGAVLDDLGGTPIVTIDVRAPSAPVLIGR